jgi:hypothetical protein
MSYCEDYPCCGHTPDDPCGRQPYDEPGYYDTSRPGNEHALCDHEFGECNVEPDEPECEDNHDCEDCDHREGGWECHWCERPCPAGAHEVVTV